MKILLIYHSGCNDRRDPYISLVPAGLCYLHAALCKAGYDTVLANFSGWSAKAIEKRIHADSPQLVGISQWTHNRHKSMELARTCRRLLPTATIAMGGAHATFCHTEALGAQSPLDLVVLGEGEATMLELAKCIAGGDSWGDVKGIAFRTGEVVVTTPPRPLIDDLDALPIPSKYLERSCGIDMQLQPEFVLTARGCPSACHFCSSPAFWGRKVRFRSPAAIVDEIMTVRERYGLIYFSMRDDTFTANRQRTMEFCRMLIEREAGVLWNCQSRVTALDEELLIAMKRAGCECVQLGVESGSPGILQQLGKNITPQQVGQAASMIKAVGINLSIYLISDVPGESEEDERLTGKLVREIHADDGYVSPLAYFPGTRLFADAVANGQVSPGVFDETVGDAVYVVGQPGKMGGRLLKAISGSRNSDAALFQRQKQYLGYCWTTNVLAGEWFRQVGDLKGARREFEEVTRNNPGNPWGWLLLGDLSMELNRRDEACNCYKKVLEIVPKHGPSLAALAGK